MYNFFKIKLYKSLFTDSFFIYLHAKLLKMFNKQKLLISGFILLVGSSVFFQNFKNKESVESKDQLKEKSIINCVQKQSKNISPKIDFSGRIKSSRKINIVSEVNGISKVNFISSFVI